MVYSQDTTLEPPPRYLTRPRNVLNALRKMPIPILARRCPHRRHREARQVQPFHCILPPQKTRGRIPSLREVYLGDLYGEIRTK